MNIFFLHNLALLAYKYEIISDKETKLKNKKIKTKTINNPDKSLELYLNNCIEIIKNKYLKEVLLDINENNLLPPQLYFLAGFENQFYHLKKGQAQTEKSKEKKKTEIRDNRIYVKKTSLLDLNDLEREVALAIKLKLKSFK